jgi:hypothetical protein
MRFPDDKTPHPVALHRRRALPCGCSMVRQDASNGTWCHVYFAHPRCQLGHYRFVGQTGVRSIWLTGDVGESDIRAAIERCAEG